MVKHGFPLLVSQAQEIQHLFPVLDHFLTVWVAHLQVAWFHRLVALLVLIIKVFD